MKMHPLQSMLLIVTLIVECRGQYVLSKRPLYLEYKENPELYKVSTCEKGNYCIGNNGDAYSDTSDNYHFLDNGTMVRKPDIPGQATCIEQQDCKIFIKFVIDEEKKRGKMYVLIDDKAYGRTAAGAMIGITTKRIAKFDIEKCFKFAVCAANDLRIPSSQGFFTPSGEYPHMPMVVFGRRGQSLSTYVDGVVDRPYHDDKKVIEDERDLKNYFKIDRSEGNKPEDKLYQQSPHGTNQDISFYRVFTFGEELSLPSANYHINLATEKVHIYGLRVGNDHESQIRRKKRKLDEWIGFSRDHILTVAGNNASTLLFKSGPSPKKPGSSDGNSGGSDDDDGLIRDEQANEGKKKGIKTWIWIVVGVGILLLILLFIICCCCCCCGKKKKGSKRRSRSSSGHRNGRK